MQADRQRVGATFTSPHLSPLFTPATPLSLCCCSGKSSIVCALCLGLGGDPRNMSRGKELSAYVANGKDTATISITLAGPTGEGDFVVKRTLRRAGANKWEINGEDTTSDAAQAFLRKTMRISMDNMLMFLPQELVSRC